MSDNGHWEENVEEALEVLVKAHEIQQNKELMRMIEPMLEEKINAIRGVLQLKDLRKIASDKALEEQAEAEKTKEDYYSSGKVLGDGQDALHVQGKI